MQKIAGGGGRDLSQRPLVRRRHPLGARPAGAPHARLRAVHGPPGSLAVHPSHRRRAARRRDAYTPADEQLFTMLARVLASELERESNARDLRRFNDLLRDQAKGMGAIGRVAKALADGDDARVAICEAACEVMDAPVAFLLEPSGREFVSTAMAGVAVQPVTIQPREGAG